MATNARHSLLSELGVSNLARCLLTWNSEDKPWMSVQNSGIYTFYDPMGPNAKMKVKCKICESYFLYTATLPTITEALSSTRLMFDIDGPKVFISKIYKCEQGHKVRGSNPIFDILCSRNFILTEKYASTACFIESIFFDTCSGLSFERQNLKFQRMFNLNHPIKNYFQKYEDTVPASKLLISVFMQHFYQNRIEIFGVLGHSEESRIICGDHTFYSVRNIGKIQGTEWKKSYAALYTMFSADEKKIILVIPTVTVSNKELKPYLERLNVLEDAMLVSDKCHSDRQLAKFMKIKTLVRLDLSHFTNRIMKVIKKNQYNRARRIFQKEVARCIRKPNDIGIKRKENTPSAEEIKINLLKLKVIASDLFTGNTLSKLHRVINTQMRHCPCLANIPVNGSTNKCENFHRNLKYNCRSITNMSHAVGLARIYGYTYLEAVRKGVKPEPNVVNTYLMKKVLEMMNIDTQENRDINDVPAIKIHANRAAEIFNYIHQFDRQSPVKTVMLSSDEEIMQTCVGGSLNTLEKTLNDLSIKIASYSLEEAMDCELRRFGLSGNTSTTFNQFIDFEALRNLSEIIGIVVVVLTGNSSLPLQAMLPTKVLSITPLFLAFQNNRENWEFLPCSSNMQYSVSNVESCRCGLGSKRTFDSEEIKGNCGINIRSRCPCRKKDKKCNISCSCVVRPNTSCLNDRPVGPRAPSWSQLNTRRINSVPTDTNPSTFQQPESLAYKILLKHLFLQLEVPECDKENTWKSLKTGFPLPH